MAGHAVIVGASLGGLRAAEQLVAAGWDGPVTVVGAERHMPYTRPPLSKEVLRGLDTAAPSAEVCADGGHPQVAFRVRPALEAVAWRLGCRAVGASIEERSVRLDDGTELSYDALVVATGLAPRRLPLTGGEADRFVVRTLDDAARLRPRLTEGTRVVVIGGGFIGCEIAATARALGCEVTVVEPEPAPMARALGRELGAAVERHHTERGIAFRLGRTVAGFHTDGGERLSAVLLDDGSVLDAAVVVEAVGSRPNVDWLAGNGLDLTDGVLCDNHLRVEGRPGVAAVGDIARFPNLLFDDVPRRVEHWAIPTETARRAAATLVAHQRGEPADPAPFAPMPTFWSDQFDLRIQGVGAFMLGDRRRVLEGALDADDALHAGVAVGAFAGDRLVGAVTIGLPAARSIALRRQIADAAVEVMA